MKTPSDRRRLVLLDSHAILHRAYHALPDFSTASGRPTGALYGLSSMLIGIIENLKPDYIVACYDVKGPTYRHEAYKDYKAGRVKTEDDLIAQINASRDIFKALDIPIYDKQGFEADDMLGTIVEQVTADAALNKSIEIMIASGDMDTLQLVDGDRVKVYTFKKGIKDTVIYNEAAVKERYGFGPEHVADYKGLRGDPSDNIIGIKGIGEKTATALISAFGGIEDIYKALDAGKDAEFAAAGITPRIIQLLKDNKEEAEFSKMLATIRRDAPITFVMPTKTFKEALEPKKIQSLWAELEFRTLAARLNQAIEGKTAATAAAKKEEAKGKGGAAGGSNGAADASGQLGLYAAASANVPPEELEKAALALWLVNSNTTNPTLDDIMAFSDAPDFAGARDAIFTELDKRQGRKVYEEIELPLIPIIKAMETRGVKIDRMVLARLSKDYHAKLAALETNIWKEVGVEFNINSPKQLGEVLFDKLGLVGKNMKKTDGGARSTRESELEKLRDAHPVVPHLFEYRELQKLLSTYIDAIPPLLDSHDRLHTHFIQSGSTTGRMASQNPGLQNIPIKSELGRPIRSAFIADKGFKLVSFDYSQMELRIAAFLSGDEKMIAIFKNGEDVHASVAAHVFGVPQKEVTPEMRRRAKVINFGIIYGMGVLALKQNLGTSRAEAQKFYDDYFKTFSTLATYLDQVKAETARHGYTETFFGRRRYFEGIMSKIPYIRAQAERMAINAPIQGTEADVIKLAMIHIDAYIREKKLSKDVFPLLQVHDELIYEIREEKAEAVAREIEKIMQSVIDPSKTHGVVMTAQGAIGDSWGDLK